MTKTLKKQTLLNYIKYNDYYPFNYYNKLKFSPFFAGQRHWKQRKQKKWPLPFYLETTWEGHRCQKNWRWSLYHCVLQEGNDHQAALGNVLSIHSVERFCFTCSDYAHNQWKSKDWKESFLKKKKDTTKSTAIYKAFCCKKQLCFIKAHDASLKVFFAI